MISNEEIRTHLISFLDEASSSLEVKSRINFILSVMECYCETKEANVDSIETYRWQDKKEGLKVCKEVFNFSS